MTPGLRQVESWLDAALSFVYPEICQICYSGRATAQEGYVCGRCRSAPNGVRFVEQPFCERCGLPVQGEVGVPFECSNCTEADLQFRQARAAVVATDLAREIIVRYKYLRSMWFEPLLADLLVGRAGPWLMAEACDLIVPIPLHALRQRDREFNQAERLAARLSEAAGVPLNAGLVERVKETRTQTKLSRRERAANMKAAFRVRKGRQLAGARIVLIDDVLTTGATASACARALLDSGAADVCVWTVARAVMS